MKFGGKYLGVTPKCLQTIHLTSQKITSKSFFSSKKSLHRNIFATQ